MELSTLRIILSHLNTLEDIASTAEDLARDEYSCDDMLRTVRVGLIDTIRATNPGNSLAIAMLEATNKIDDECECASYLYEVVGQVKRTTEHLIKVKQGDREARGIDRLFPPVENNNELCPADID